MCMYTECCCCSVLLYCAAVVGAAAAACCCCSSLCALHPRCSSYKQHTCYCQLFLVRTKILKTPLGSPLVVLYRSVISKSMVPLITKTGKRKSIILYHMIYEVPLREVIGLISRGCGKLKKVNTGVLVYMMSLCEVRSCCTTAVLRGCF